MADYVPTPDKGTWAADRPSIGNATGNQLETTAIRHLSIKYLRFRVGGLLESYKLASQLGFFHVQSPSSRLNFVARPEPIYSTHGLAMHRKNRSLGVWYFSSLIRLGDVCAELNGSKLHSTFSTDVQIFRKRSRWYSILSEEFCGWEWLARNVFCSATEHSSSFKT